MRNLDLIFNPKTIAVIGASNQKEKVGYGLFKNLAPYKGRLYPVNPNQKKVQGIKSFSAIDQIEGKIDLAIVAVPAKAVPEITRQCVRKGVGACIVVSAGFGEAGEKGQKLENEIKKIIAGSPMRLLGPNCLGIIKTKNNLNASFATKMPRAGKVAVLSQSGALGSAIIEWSLEQNVGIDTFVSMGSMLDIGFADLIDYFGQKPEVNGLIIYMESVKDAGRFIRAVRKTISRKPIIALKAGATPAGSRATASHTGSLAGNARVYEAVFRQLGILQVREMEEIFVCLRTLYGCRLPKGPRLAIVTNAGAGGVMALDALSRRGGEPAKLSAPTLRKLNQNLPHMWSGSNPVDILGDADPARFEIAVSACVKDPKVDGVLVIFTSQYCGDSVKTAEVLSEIGKKHTKPILTSWVGPSNVNKVSQILSEGEVPNYATPEKAVGAFVNMWHYQKNLTLLKTPARKPEKRRPPPKKLKRLIEKFPGKFLPEFESKEFLREYQIPVVATRFAASSARAVLQAREIGFPVVLKTQSLDIIHKTEAGGVLLNLRTEKEVAAGFKKLTRAAAPSFSGRKAGVSVQKMIEKIDYELILGARLDPDFGPIVLFGHGGVEVELYDDTSLGLPPLSLFMAEKIIRETKISRFLEQGFRGKKPVDIKRLAAILQRFSYLVLDFPEIKEIDVNPLIIRSGEPLALDARVML